MLDYGRRLDLGILPSPSGMSRDISKNEKIVVRTDAKDGSAPPYSVDNHLAPLRVLMLLVLTELRSNTLAGYLIFGFFFLTGRASGLSTSVASASARHVAGGLSHHHAGHHQRQSG